MHVFLTGDIQVGKTTLINKVLNELPKCRLGGFRTVTKADIPGTAGSVYIVRANESCSAGAACTGGAGERFGDENHAWILRGDENHAGIHFGDENREVIRFGDENRVGIRCGNPGPKAFPEVFDSFGVSILADAEDCDLILMDEIGKMERKALIFTGRVLELLNGDVPVFGVLRKEGSTPLQEQIRSHSNVRLIEVNKENRDRLVPELVHLISTSFPSRQRE